MKIRRVLRGDLDHACGKKDYQQWQQWDRSIRKTARKMRHGLRGVLIQVVRNSSVLAWYSRAIELVQLLQ